MRALSLLLVLMVAVAGCGGGGSHGGSFAASTAAVATAAPLAPTAAPAVATPSSGAVSVSPGTPSPLVVVAAPPPDFQTADEVIAYDVHVLARTLGLDAATEAKVKEAARRSWDGVLVELQRRAEAIEGDKLSEDALRDLFLDRQRALDEEIATLIGQPLRPTFLDLGGRLKEEK